MNVNSSNSTASTSPTLHAADTAWVLVDAKQIIENF